MTSLAGMAENQPLPPDADQAPVDALALAVPQYPGAAAADGVTGTAGAETLSPAFELRARSQAQPRRHLPRPAATAPASAGMRSRRCS
jgi:hypothetical protein